MNLIPLGGRVVITPDKQESKVGGIIIPDNATDKPATGVVTALPKGYGYAGKDEVQIGDRVLFKKYVGREVDFDGEKRLILNLEDLIAVIG